MAKRRLSILVIIVMFIAQYTYGLGVPAQVKAEGTGETTSVTSAVYEISPNIITSVSLSVYGPDGQIDPGPVYEQGSAVTLDYTWALPNGHGYHSGDTFTFQLPSEFKLYNDIQGSLESDEGTVGTFLIKQNTHKVIMTFNSYIQDHDNVHGTLRINTKFDEQVIKENIEQQILFPITDGVQTFTFIFRPSGASIDKKGLPQGFNAKKITWTVDVNKKLDTVESAMVTDPIPAGLSLADVGAELSVYRLNIALNGTVTKGDMVSPTDYAAEVTNGILKISFNSTLTAAYRIEYTTSITDETIKSFVNKATFSGKDFTPVDSTATVAVARGEDLNKYVTAYDWGKQIISWAIDYNYSEKEIEQGNAILTDLYTNTQDLLEGSLKVYPITFDSAGNATKGTLLTKDIDYSLAAAEGVDKTGFKLIFNSDISSAYHIEYQTKSAVRILNNTTITNSVSDSTYSDDATQVIRPTVIYKNLNGVNYNTKTADWKITINGDNYPMGNVVVTDTFPEGGLKFIPDTLVVRNGLGNKVNSSEYELDYINPVQPNNGFKVSFHSMITGSYTISYSVEFNNEWITTKTEQFHNTAHINWVVDSSVTHSASAMGLFDPRDEVKNNGFKFGSYNAATKEITWTIGVNYNGRSLNDARISDLVKAPQTLLENSIKVYKMNISVNGTPTQGDEVNSSNYSVEPSTVANDTLLNVKLGSINSAYYVVFKTSLEGKLTSSKVENKANLYDGLSLRSKELIATVNIPYGGEIIDKNGVQVGDKINWTLPINRGQSYIKNAVITDTPSSNQKLILDSFHLYPTNVGSNGIPVKSTPELVRGADKDYTLEFLTDASGKQTFVLKFNKDIKTPYLLLYQSLIAANHGERVTNTAKLTGDNVTLVSREITKIMIVGVSSGSGTGSGERSTLTVKKVDSENSTVVLSGAIFNLYRISNAERILIDTQTTQPNGTAVFSSILSGNYILKEITAPDGYTLDSQDRAVTLTPGANVVLTVTNKKVVVPTPTPSATASATPSATASATASAIPSATASATPSATASPKPGTVTFPPVVVIPTPSTIPGEIVIVESAVPAGPGIVQTSPPTVQPTSSPIVQEVPDDNVPAGGIDIDEDDVPKGTIPDTSNINADVQNLPKTGENSPLPLYLMGMGLIIAGYVLNRTFKRGKRSDQ